jgi:hypothetical protein
MYVYPIAKYVGELTPEQLALNLAETILNLEGCTNE